MTQTASTSKLRREGSGWAFEHDSSEYQAIYLPTLNKVQLWYRPWFGGQRRYEIGHSRELRTMTPENMADWMRRFVVGEIDHAEYNSKS